MTWPGLVFGLCALTFGCSLAGYAQTPPVISGPPDVVVIVYQQPGGADQVGITYSRTVPRSQALQDLNSLAQKTGWRLEAVNIKDAAAPVHSTLGRMTGVEFQSPGVIQDQTHTLPIETFARAFHKYRRLNALFIVGPQFQFQGSRFYADNDIKVALDQHGSAYTYSAEILNSSFGPLSFSQPHADRQAVSKRRSAWGLLLGIFGAALAAGLLVYILTSRLTASAPQPEAEDTQEADPRQEVGTKR